MAHTITRCPKCSTSFRITEAHLKSAKGAVRCGSCLNIFNARDHIVTPTLQTPAIEQSDVNKAVAQKASAKTAPQKSTPKHPPTPSQPAAPAPKKPAIDKGDDDILISDDMSFEDSDSEPTDQFQADFNDNIFYSKPLQTQDSNLFEREIIDDEEDEDENSDESWALDLLRQDTRTQPAISDEELPETTAPDEYGYSETEYADPYQAEDYSSEDNLPESDDSFDSAATEDNQESPAEPRHSPVFTAAEPTIEELESIVDGPYNEQPEQTQYIHAIEPEPVEFAYKRSHSWLESKLLWGSLTLLMTIAIIGQIAWLQFDKLSRVQPYRGYYAHICNVFNCQLPALSDRSAIKAVNLVVRSHPKQKGALLVDAVLQNSALYTQAFPALDLIFTDINNNPVAARRFEPSEYLGGELAGRRNMPSRQPIHIALEIIDPGPDAVNYRISIAN